MKNVFLSHVHEDDEGLGKLKDLAKKNGLTIRDYSITSEKFNRAESESYIKTEILGPRIRRCDVLVVYVSRETRNSDYVDWEIEYAEKQGKRIVGVWANGESGCDLPDALAKYADAVVGWNGNRIVDAIKGEISGFQNPDGSNFAPRDIDRFSCA